MPLSRTPFFPLPFPDPTTDFDDLPQAVRDCWVGWAKANEVGWVDYHRIIRPTRDAYEAILSSDAAEHGAASVLTYPPEALPPSTQALAQLIGDATIGDILSLRTARLITADTAFLIWATAPQIDPADIDGHENLFIGTFPCPAGTPMNTYLAEIGAAYVAQFGSLAAKLGDSLVVWAFECQNGNLSYAGAWTLAVKTVAAFGSLAYWPLNEASGPRRSIAQPLNAVIVGTVASTAGPIDEATLINPGTPGYLITAAPTEPRITDGPFTLACWVNLAAVATAYTIAAQGWYNPPLDLSWLWWFNAVPGAFRLDISDGIAAQTLLWSALGVPTINTWYHLAVTVDPIALTWATYTNGALDTNGALTVTPWTLELPIAIGAQDGHANHWHGALAELTAFNRILSTAEIAELYNAGAGLRYPYP